jgi:hypothetical protein
LRKFDGGSGTKDLSNVFALPSPDQPLKEHQRIDPTTIIAAMEASLKAANVGPAFEAARLAAKNPERFLF